VLQKLAGILSADPDNPRWYEMRAQVRLGSGVSVGESKQVPGYAEQAQEASQQI
jgi:hypothetical protein